LYRLLVEININIRYDINKQELIDLAIDYLYNALLQGGKLSYGKASLLIACSISYAKYRRNRQVL